MGGEAQPVARRARARERKEKITTARNGKPRNRCTKNNRRSVKQTDDSFLPE